MLLHQRHYALVLRLDRRDLLNMSLLYAGVLVLSISLAGARSEGSGCHAMTASTVLPVSPACHMVQRSAATDDGDPSTGSGYRPRLAASRSMRSRCRQLVVLPRTGQLS